MPAAANAMLPNPANSQAGGGEKTHGNAPTLEGAPAPTSSPERKKKAILDDAETTHKLENHSEMPIGRTIEDSPATPRRDG